MLGNLGLKGGPVPAVGGGDVPHVELKLSLGGGRSGEGLVSSVLLGKLHGSLDGSKVDGLEDVLVELPSLGRLEGVAHDHEGVGESLDADSDGAVAHVGAAGLLDGVEVLVNDPVKVLGDDLGDLIELLEVVTPLAIGHLSEGDGGEVTNCDLVGGRVLDDLRAEVGGADGSKVLLVGLAVAVVLEEHVRGSGLDLGVEDSEPELLGLDGTPSLALFLVLLVECLVFGAVGVGEVGALVWAHEGPVTVALDALHEDVRNPEGVE